MSRNTVNVYVSEWFPTAIIGLLQGLIPSPILFLVYAGDLAADPKKSPFYDNPFSPFSEATNKNDVTPLSEL